MVNNANTQKNKIEESVENDDITTNQIEHIDFHDLSFRSIQVILKFSI